MGLWIQPPPKGANFVSLRTHGALFGTVIEYLSERDIPHAMISGLEIKRSLGIARGKDGRINASKIALYAYRPRDEIRPSLAQSKEIRTIKKLLSLRDRLIRQRAGYKVGSREQKDILKRKGNELLFIVQDKMIRELSKQIKEIENEMQQIIKSSPELDHIFVLLKTTKCIGDQVALFLLLYTGAFTKFRNARQFFAYYGVAPFPNRSGTSLRGKTRVSHLANKKMKSLLDMCAKSWICYNMEIKDYYYYYYFRRLAEGKSKMSTVNVIRKKLILRVFTVINRDTPYVDLWKYAS
ncbi:transposase [Arenibacter sp. M-2]|uniref:transposase n=1 Tax=Arenibacter sp. M-2 TaxID=3053612 RepID=UPI00257120D7|nr:transposase [Arenibacter sp. M-2]MDL5511183.1 transposase [Arenibacter sp. M-2]